MNPSTRLETYLQSLRRRIQALIVARTAAATTAVLLLATSLGVWWLQRSNFLPAAALVTRLLIALALLAIAVSLLWLPLRRLRAGQGAPEFERLLPDQQGRIQTYIDARERASTGEPSFMLELLAEDAATRAEAQPVRTVVSNRTLWGGVTVAVVGLMALLGILAFGPAHWGYASRYLLLGMQLPRDAVPVRKINISPGNATVRRNSDLSIRATIEGFDPEHADVFVRFDNESDWQRASMQRGSDEHKPGEWEFKLYALRGALRYYVSAGQTRSAEYTVAVADLPRINKVRLTYSYPDWTGLDPLIEEQVRDIEAVADTNVRLEVFADAPLSAAGVMVDGTLIPLSAQGNTNVGTIVIKEPGNYHITAQVANETVNLTDDYRIDIIQDQQPTVQIVKPGRDVRATGIEEVPVRVLAKDDFKLREVQLRYSVNGGKWQTLNLAAGEKQTNVSSLLELEQLGAAADGKTAQPLAAGDLVSYYAVAKDHKETVQTDLFMVQVQPFERRFKEGQGGGGGGGSGNGDDSGAISERQREILLATWNLQRSDERNKQSREQLQESADLMADLQKTLAEQSRKVAERTRARVSLEEDERIRTFVESMERAATLMEPVVRHLNNFKLPEAIPLEQQALQQLQRAEAAFRDVQISMSSDDAKQGSQTAQNFAEMFELEMDVEKNQYETQSQASMQNEQEELDEAIRKLKELAERQEKLAQADRNNMPLPEQRWRQEQLRREAEDLKRRLAELQRNQQSAGQRSQSQQQQQSGQSTGEPSGQQSAQNSEQAGQEQSETQENPQPNARQGQQSERLRQLANTTESVQRALDEMRRASNSKGTDGEASTQSAREASRNLKQALRNIDSPQKESLAAALDDIQQRTQRLESDQQKVQSDLSGLAATVRGKGNLNGVDTKQVESLIDKKRAMASEIAELQKEMRDLLNDHRKSAPQAARKLAETLGDLENWNLNPRLTRGANALTNAQRTNGRSIREVSASEGIITDGIENLKDSLREASQLAKNENNSKSKDPGAEELLSDLAELRRSLREAQASTQPGDEAQQGKAQRSQSSGNPGDVQSGKPGDPQAVAQNTPSERSATNQDRQGSATSDSNTSSSSEPNRSARAPSPSGSGLGVWDLESRGSFNFSPDIGRLRRDANRITDQINNLTNRFRGQQLSAEDIAALRKLSWELKKLSGDTVSEKVKTMSTVLDQIELATLAAVERSKNANAPRATVTSEDPAAYRETVAEYYRRLGNKPEK